MSERATWKAGTAYESDFYVFDSSGAGVAGLVNGDFTKSLKKDGAVSAVPVTVTELAAADGGYKATYTPTAAVAGYYSLRVTQSAYNVRGWQDDIDVVLYDAVDVLDGDESIDKLTTPDQWQQVIKKKASATELVRKKLYKSDGTTKIVSDDQIVGQRTEA